jgi:hypothetical protein
VKVDTAQLRESAQGVQRAAQHFADSPIGKETFYAPADRLGQGTPVPMQVAKGDAYPSMDAKLQFLKVLNTLTGDLAQFGRMSGRSVRVISLALGAACHGYESGDEINAGDITRSIFVNKPEGMSQRAYEISPEYRNSYQHRYDQQLRKQR